jgi:putative inorganic carbon (hco3(-)) transporter
VRAADVRALWKTLEVCVLVFAGFGIIQAIFLPGFAQMVYPDSRLYADWDPQGHRLVSTFLDPNFAGAFIVIGLLIQLSLVSYGERVAAWKPLLLLTALVMTLSRSSVLALFAGALMIVAIRGVSRRALWLGAATLVLLSAAAPALLRFAAKFNKLQVDASALERLVTWTRGLRILADHPILGVGFNTYGFVQERYGFERSYAASYSIDGGLSRHDALGLAARTTDLAQRFGRAVRTRPRARCLRFVGGSVRA